MSTTADPPREEERPDLEPVAPRPRRHRSRSGERKPSATQIRTQLRESAMGVAVAAMMVSPSGSQAMAIPEARAAIEKRADAFAAAWAAVAQENERFARAIQQLLTGGVYVNAAVQTAAFGVVVSAFMGRPLVNPAVASMLLPELAGFQFVPRENAEQAAEAPPEVA